MKRGFAIMVLLGYGQASLAVDINNVDWPMYQFDASHSGFVETTLDYKNFTLAWKYKLEGKQFTYTPVVTTNNYAFIIDHRKNDSFGNSVCAITIHGGKKKWCQSFSPAMANPPSANNNILYVQSVYHSEGTFLKALNAETSELIFETPFGAQWQNYLPPTLFDGHIYATGGAYGGMYSFIQDTGTLEWFSALDGYDRWTPAVNNQYAIGYTNGKLDVLNREDGDLLMQITDPNWLWNGYSVDAAPVIIAENKVIMRQTNHLTLFNLENKSTVSAIESYFEGQPAFDGEYIYAIEDNSLLVLDTNLHSLWRVTDTKLNFPGNVIVTENLIFVSSSKATIAISKETKEIVWKYAAGGLLTLARGHLFISNRDSLTAIKVT